MKKISIFKYLISFMLMFTSISYASTYVSLSPVPTEIIYALGAEKNLLGVSSACKNPKAVKEKPIIGDVHYVNMEMLVKLKPDYLFAMSSAKPKLGELSLIGTKPIYFEFTTIEDIYKAIREISQLTNTEQNAEKIIEKIEDNIDKNKTSNPKRILYVVQMNPLITIGKKSFITDIIKKSGHISVTDNIAHYYPNITLEYAIKTNPDIIVVCFPTNIEKIEPLFPNSKFLYLDEEKRDIINSPGPRVYEAVKLFSKLNFNEKPTH